jgi:hypothetical protein
MSFHSHQDEPLKCDTGGISVMQENHHTKWIHTARKAFTYEICSISSSHGMIVWYIVIFTLIKELLDMQFEINSCHRTVIRSQVMVFTSLNNLNVKFVIRFF